MYNVVKKGKANPKKPEREKMTRDQKITKFENTAKELKVRVPIILLFARSGKYDSTEIYKLNEKYETEYIKKYWGNTEEAAYYCNKKMNISYNDIYKWNKAYNLVCIKKEVI